MKNSYVHFFGHSLSDRKSPQIQTSLLAHDYRYSSSRPLKMEPCFRSALLSPDIQHSKPTHILGDFTEEILEYICVSHISLLQDLVSHRVLSVWQKYQFSQISVGFQVQLMVCFPAQGSEEGHWPSSRNRNRDTACRSCAHSPT